MSSTVDELQTIYRNAVTAFYQTPPIPFGSPKLTSETIRTIKNIITMAFQQTYNPDCTIELI